MMDNKADRKLAELRQHYMWLGVVGTHIKPLISRKAWACFKIAVDMIYHEIGMHDVKEPGEWPDDNAQIWRAML